MPSEFYGACEECPQTKWLDRYVKSAEARDRLSEEVETLELRLRGEIAERERLEDVVALFRGLVTEEQWLAAQTKPRSGDATS